MASISKRILPAKQNGKASVRFVVHYRDRSGKQHRPQFERRSKAEQFKADVEIALRNGVDVVSVDAPRVAATEEVVTFGMVRGTWSAARRVSRARTAAEVSLAKHLAKLDPMPVAAIRASDVRAVVTAVTDAGLSAETASAVLRMAKMVLDQAAEDEYVPGNVAARVRAPQVSRPPLDADDVLTADEAHRLVEAAPERWRALLAVLVFVGARWSEGLGVRVRDVDMLRRRIHLGSHVVEEVAGTVVRRDGGKTRGSDRWIPMPSVVADLVAEHLVALDVGPEDLIFTNTKGLSPLRGNFRRQVYLPTLLGAGIGRQVTVRNLRHTAASMMLAAGLSPLDVARRLGHSKPTTTMNVYARFVPDPVDTATAALDTFFANNLRTPG